MNKELQSWLSHYVSFGPIDLKSGLNELTVDLFISDICNLNCKHCYFGTTRTIGPPLTLKNWKYIIESLYINGVRHFHISGKESSLDNRTIEIVAFIKSLKGTYSGVVSNGTGNHLFYNSLVNEGIDYLEFSIDGLEKTHNYIRGKKVFSQLINLLKSLSLNSNIIDISTCLNRNSIDEYFSLVDICMDFGIKKFFATPYLYKGNGKSFSFFSITPLVLSQLIEMSFKFLEAKPNKKIVMRYCIPHEMTYSMIENSPFFERILIDYLTGKTNLIYQIEGK